MGQKKAVAMYTTWFRRVLIVCGLSVLMACGNGPPAMTIRALGTDLAFYPKRMTLPAASTVTLTFENPSNLPHNYILVDGNEAALQAVNDAAQAAGAAGDYIPADGAGMYAHSPLLQAQTIENFSFTVPSAGTYFYFCSFPGHLEGGMRGILVAN
jgi:plastocyanin